MVEPTSLKNDGVKVSWDDDIPNISQYDGTVMIHSCSKPPARKFPLRLPVDDKELKDPTTVVGSNTCSNHAQMILLSAGCTSALPHFGSCPLHSTGAWSARLFRFVSLCFAVTQLPSLCGAPTALAHQNHQENPLRSTRLSVTNSFTVYQRKKSSEPTGDTIWNPISPSNGNTPMLIFQLKL